MNKKRGQSLIETVVALSLLGIAIMATTSLAVTLIRYSIQAKARTQASSIAQEALEMTRVSSSVAPLAAGTYIIDSNYQLIAGTSSSKNIDGINYQRTINVTNCLSSDTILAPDPTKYQKVKVIISWTLPGAAQSIEMVSLIRKDI